MIELLRKRRSIRKFQNKPIEPGKIQRLEEALLRSPSSRNFDPWHFIFVNKPAILEKLSKAKKHGSAFLKDASLGIVVCGDDQVSDVWIEDCSIASILVQITAQSLGLGSCWVQIRKRMYNEETASEIYIQKILEIPHSLNVLSIIGVGYPIEHPEPIPAEKLKANRIHINRW